MARQTLGRDRDRRSPGRDRPIQGRQVQGHQSRVPRSRQIHRKIRHQTSLSFPFLEVLWSINLLDTTDSINVNKPDGDQWLISFAAGLLAGCAASRRVIS
jgi:hypothetical protein